MTERLDPRQELAREPALAWRADVPPFDATQLQRRWATTPAGRKWAAIGAATVLTGPFAIAAALVENSTAGVGLVFLLVVFGPLVEESVKGAGALMLAELRPWLVPVSWVLPVATAVAGLCFAAIENWWYLVVLIDDPSAELVRWRWTLGPLVHGLSSLIVGFGAVRLWRGALARGTAEFGDAVPALAVAAGLHGTFNLVALVLSITGTGPTT